MSGNGQHTLYAASKDSEGNKETPANNCATSNATTDTFQYNLKTASSLASGNYTITVQVAAPNGSGVVNTETVEVYIRRWAAWAGAAGLAASAAVRSPPTSASEREISGLTVQ